MPETPARLWPTSTLYATNGTVHADSWTRERLQARFAGVASFAEVLRADVVTELMSRIDRACRYAKEVVGESAPRWEGTCPAGQH